MTLGSGQEIHIGPDARNLVAVLGYCFSRHMMFTVGLLTPYFMEHLGLDFQEVMITQMVFAATVVLCELPSGWLADHWRRVDVMRFSTLLCIIGVSLIWTAGGLAQLLLAELVIGIAFAMLSGADSALLYDSLAAAGRQKEYLKWEARKHGIAMTGIALSSLSAGWLYSHDKNLIFALELGCYLVALLLTMLITEPVRNKPSATERGPGHLARAVQSQLRGEPMIFWYVLLAAVLFSSGAVNFWLQQAYMLAQELPVQWFGAVTAAGFLTGALAAQGANRLQAWLGGRALLLVICLLASCGYALTGFLDRMEGLIFLFVGPAAWGLALPVFQNAINQRVPSERRATMLSLISLAPRLAFIPVSYAIGWLSDHDGSAVGYLALAFYLLVFAGPVLWMVWHKQGRPLIAET